MRYATTIFRHALPVALLVLALPAPAATRSLTLSDGWFRALPPSVPSGAYFTLHNSGDRPVTLTGADSPACGMLMLHQSQEMGGMGHMADVASVDVPAGGTLRFAPGGYHLMCMDARPVLKPGATAPVTLHFADGARITGAFAVRNAAGK